MMCRLEISAIWLINVVFQPKKRSLTQRNIIWLLLKRVLMIRLELMLLSQPYLRVYADD